MQPKQYGIKMEKFIMESKKIMRLFLLGIFGAAIVLTNSIILASTSRASTKTPVYDISSKIIIDGKLISSPRIIAKANQPAAMSVTDKSGTGNLIVRLIATEKSKKAINIKFDVQYKNGSELVETKPEFILRPNQKGSILLSSSGHAYQMSVVAKTL